MYAPLLILLVLLIGGVALFGAFAIDRKARQAVDRRVNLISKSSGGNPEDDAASMSVALAEKIGVELRDLFALGISRRWGMHTENGVLCIIALVSVLIVWSVLHLFLGISFFVVLPISLAAFVFVPRMILQYEQSAAERNFLRTFPDAIDMVVRILRAGLPITEAVRSVGREALPPVDRIFSMLSEQMSIGIPLNAAFENVGKWVGLSDFRFFSVAVSLQYATGGNLATALETLTDIMRKRRAIRQKTSAATAEVRLSAYVLGAIPFFVLGALLITNASYLAPLLTDPRGHTIIAVAVCNLLLAFIIMRQMLRSITSSGL